jgi:hypothetical protein
VRKRRDRTCEGVVRARSGHVFVEVDLFDAIARIAVIVSSRWRSTTTVG